jgi:RNA polymerase sigma-70 factor (ECF subfamily)
MSAGVMFETTLAQLDHEKAGASTVLAPLDEESFRVFYERHGRAVRAYLSRLTGDVHLADDLMQETFYRFLRAGATHESESHRRNSLFHIATNLARDSMRSNQRRPTVALPDEAHETVSLQGSRSDVATLAEGRTDLARAMAHLRPQQREMLWLAYAQGSSHAEIAETLGLKTASVKLLLFRARRKLAGLLSGAPVSPANPERKKS